MSSAHRPTWAPAQAKEGRANSRIYSVRDMASHTRLKFRAPAQQSGADAKTEGGRRDLKLELLMAERAAEAKKKGISVDELPPIAGTIEAAPAPAAVEDQEEEQAAKRRKLLEEVGDLDKDDSDDEDDDAPVIDLENGDSATAGAGKGKEKAVDQDSEEDESDSDSDDEDETAELLRELEKIKRERAEEKARLEAEKNAEDQTSMEERIAYGNPLLNLQNAFGATPGSPSPSLASTQQSSFGVKRRWDDDVIFKNQARTQEGAKNEFVNDLLRTEFHKKFMKKFIA